MSAQISVLILTKNEERDIEGCIRSVLWSDDIHVLDSYSTDATCDIAERLGARVSKRPFDSYSSQSNFGVKELAYAHEWILMVDADERIPPALASEMALFVQGATSDVAAARLRRRDFLCGTWLKHASISPFNIRLFRRGCVSFTRDINPITNISGKVVDLESHFDHYSFSKGMRHWFEKHNQYSDMEARLIATHQSISPSWRTALFGEDPNERRVHQKALFYRMPARPLIKFLYMLVIRRSFLDGRAGIRYTILQSIYEYMIVLKTQELEGERAVADARRADIAQ